MLTICLTDEALWWLLKAAENVILSRTAGYYSDFRAMVDIPRLWVSVYYPIIISAALDLLPFWAKEFDFLGNINYVPQLYPGADILYVADVNLLLLISYSNKPGTFF